MKARKSQIEAAAKEYADSLYIDTHIGDSVKLTREWSFIKGAEWADENNPWKQLCEEMAEILIKSQTRIYDWERETVKVLEKYEAIKNDLCRTPPV